MRLPRSNCHRAQPRASRGCRWFCLCGASSSRCFCCWLQRPVSGAHGGLAPLSSARSSFASYFLQILRFQNQALEIVLGSIKIALGKCFSRYSNHWPVRLNFLVFPAAFCQLESKSEVCRAKKRKISSLERYFQWALKILPKVEFLVAEGGIEPSAVKF